MGSLFAKPYVPNPAATATKPQNALQSAEQEPSATHNKVNYLLLVRLRNVSNPPITRLITVPADLPLTTLHDALGWDHEVHLLGVDDAALRESLGVPQGCVVACLGGERHPCAEDVGGPDQWVELKGLFADLAMPDR